jgi:hypothetical protein
MENTGEPARYDCRMLRPLRLSCRTFLGAAACLVLGLLGFAATAEAQIVALGASNTRGMGVAFEAAYPAQLEAMLRAKGYSGGVLNAGISGDTTTGMLTRLDMTLTQKAERVGCKSLYPKKKIKRTASVLLQT